MYFPPSIKEAQENEAPTKKLLLHDNSNIMPFIKQFGYFGTLITPELNEDIEIQTRITKAKSQMGFLQHFFMN